MAENLPNNLIYCEEWSGEEAVEIEQGDTTPSYSLRMEKINDGIKLPQMTMDKIEIEAVFDSSMSVYRYFVDARSGSNYYCRASDRNQLQTNGFSASGFAWDMRTTLTLTAPRFTDDITIFSRQDIYQSSRGILYRVTCYLDNVVIAHYDMTLGHVQDQSGNEHHATLFGGTWLRSDGA